MTKEELIEKLENLGFNRINSNKYSSGMISISLDYYGAHALVFSEDVKVNKHCLYHQVIKYIQDSIEIQIG